MPETKAAVSDLSELVAFLTNEKSFISKIQILVKLVALKMAQQKLFLILMAIIWSFKNST
jgi:hypothetical protein